LPSGIGLWGVWSEQHGQYTPFLPIPARKELNVTELRSSYTANVYRDLRVLYKEIRVRGFQIYGDCMLPTIPEKISCKVKKEKKM
jgi:hypothetical protein